MMKKLSVKNQFRLGTALILVFFCSGFSLLEYKYQKDFATQSIYKETALHLATADATRTYVKDILRPRITELLPDGEFVREAMSTTYLGREVMARIREKFPDFTYKRAAFDPVNPVNRADEFERRMLEWFRENPNRRQWSGIIKKGNHSYYAQLNAIYAEKECLTCHGDPRDAPPKMIEIYGGKGGFGYREGQVVAADAVLIPVDVMFMRIKEKAIWVFLIGGGALVFLFGFFYLLFNRTVILSLRDLITTFSSITGEETALKNVGPADEIDQLKEAFEAVASHLSSAHEDLKASETKYRRLFEASQDAILICDAGSRLEDINDAGIALFGFRNRAEALEIETFYQLFWDGRRAAALMGEIDRNGAVREYEVEMVDRVGRQMVVLITAHRRQEEGRAAGGFVAVLRDITEKRRMDKHLAQTEKLAAMGQLAAGVAHEINNPLGVISLYSNLIAKTAPADPQIQKDLKVIHKHARHCKEIVESLLRFARRSDPKKVSCDIHAVIDEVLGVLTHRLESGSIEVSRRFAADLPPVTADTGQMKQVFMNLFLNAAQAMPEGGRITVTTGFKDPGMLEVRITDTGSGIAPKDLDRIFDPFFTTKGPGAGTGLGLSVTYGIIEQHDGRIEVESAPGSGTTFVIHLPLDSVPGET